MRLVIGLLFVITFFMATPTAYAADDAETRAIIETKMPEIVAKFGVSTEEATAYLETVIKAAIAKQVAEQDGSEVSALYADMLKQYSQVQLLGASVLAKGQKLYNEKIKGSTPGTDVPPELVMEIRAWASSAGQVLMLGSTASKTAFDYAQQSFLQDEKCRIHTDTFRIGDCLDRLDKSLNLMQTVMKHLDLMTEAISVLQLAVVARMTF